MGSPFIITIYGNDSSKVKQIAEKAFSKVDTLNYLFSDYLPSSALNRLCDSAGSGAWIQTDPLLTDILKRSLEAARLSRGSFDITIGPVVRLWREARQEKQMPAKKLLEKALQKTGYKHLHIDTQNTAVLLDLKEMKLDLGGIAKGYSAQFILDFLRSSGYPIAMVDAGGDLALGEPPAGRKGWRIGVNVPEEKERLLSQQLILKEQAVATSGDVYQYIEFDGKKYSHIINPKTGMGVTFQRNVTVIAPDGATADWLASACSILPVRKALRLIKKMPGAALLITEKRKHGIYSKMSGGFKQYLSKER